MTARRRLGATGWSSRAVVAILGALAGVAPLSAFAQEGSAPPVRSEPPPPPAESSAPEDAAPLDEAALDPNPPGAEVGDEPKLEEVTVTVSRTPARELQRSAEAVSVVDTHAAQRQTADMGEVLARTQGVAIRRSGGLGSDTRLSLNGLYDDQIRFFLDGVPLELAGYPFGIADVPVNLTQRVEIYRGVVPVRFGADALGGAINLVSDRNYETHFAGSYQVGSFGTHRVTLNGRWRHEPTGIILGGTAFLDLAKNDYPVDVEAPDDLGRLHPATVKRFHDGYRSYGGTLEAGVLDQPWAKRLSLQGFASTYDKQLQNNLVMTVPFGEVHYGESVYGSTARYEVELTPSIDLDLVANYAHRTIRFIDKSQWVYDWFGQRIRERRVAGETDTHPTDQIFWQNSGFGRGTAAWKIASEHTLRLSLSPDYTARTGDERLQAEPTARDPLSARRHLFTFVSGLEYELDLFDKRLSNIAFVKDYVYHASNQEVVPGNIFRHRNSNSHTHGGGDSLRYEFLPWLSVKASYEYATRLPRPDEVFGDGVLVLANLDLRPEVSHNANLGPRVEYRNASAGDWTLDVNGFLRDSDRLVVLLGNDKTSSYQNVYRARGLGIENALNWLSPGRYANVDGMLTWQDVRNLSSARAFTNFKGDRIPNRPYLFASWGARLRFSELPAATDTVEPFYVGRYVHQFYRGWESQGLKEYKQVVDAQVTHDAGVSWTVERYPRRVTTTFEVDNLTDAKVFDNFGVQRPGRAFYLKATGEL